MNLRSTWQKDLESVFGEANDMTGCMHPDERDERQDWLTAFLQEMVAHIRSTLPAVPTSWLTPDAPYRKIVSGRHILRLECGHTVVYVGNRIPKHRTKCPACGTNSPNS